MVAHPHKLHRNDAGVIPPPDLYQVSGSAHWANMADTALVIHRDFENNSTKVITKTSNHPYYNAGSSLGYSLNEYNMNYDTVCLVYEDECHFKLVGHFNGDMMVSYFTNKNILFNFPIKIIIFTPVN